MKLSNSFSDKVRHIFAFTWVCWECGGNGQDSGGLEIHHIMGRVSASAFNASVLCKKCHSRMNHSIEEEQKLFAINQQYLNNNEYIPDLEDIEFIKSNFTRLTTPNKLWPVHEVMRITYKMLSASTWNAGDISFFESTPLEFMTQLEKYTEAFPST